MGARPESFADQVGDVGREGFILSQPTRTIDSEGFGRAVEVAEHDARAAAVERVGSVDVGPQPFEAVAAEIERLPRSRGRRDVSYIKTC